MQETTQNPDHPMNRHPDPMLVDDVAEALCPVCTRPLEPLDDAEMDTYGIPQDRALCLCERCPTDADDCMQAYLVSWREEPRQVPPYGDYATVRVETARQVGRFDADGCFRPDPAWMDSLRTRARRAEMVWRSQAPRDRCAFCHAEGGDCCEHWDAVMARMERNRRRYTAATEMLVAFCLEEAQR